MRGLLLVLTAFVVSGCAGIETAKVPPNRLLELAESGVTVVVYRQPDFMARTLGHDLLGGVSLGLFDVFGDPVLEAGNRLVEGEGIEDPAVRIASTVAPWIAERLGAPSPNIVYGRERRSDDPESLSAVADGRGLILDVKSTDWMFDYFWAHMTRYRVIHRARVRLIEAKSGEVLGLVPCEYVSHEWSGTAPTHERLLADDAAQLKTALEKAAANCTHLVKTSIFGTGFDD